MVQLATTSHIPGETRGQQFYREHKEKRKKEQKTYYTKLRKSVLEMLGNKCKKCGFDDVRILQIDHVNGGGTKDVKSITSVYLVVVMKSILAKENKYQLLCPNCNWIKRVENNEVRNGEKIT